MSKKANYVYYPGKIRSVLRGETTKQQSGYTKRSDIRKDGDNWVDSDGKKWERKNGINISKPMFTPEDGVRVPLFCPNCGRIMGKSQKDSDIFWKFGFCLDCLVERDNERIVNGEMGVYQAKYLNEHMKGYLLETKTYIEEYLDKIKNGIEIINEDGTIEKWDGDQKKIEKFWLSELENINKSLEEFNNIGDGDG